MTSSTLDLIIRFCGLPRTVSKKITDDILAFWKFSDASDSSGNGYNFTNYNSVAFVSGKIGNCAYSDGTNGFSVDLSASPIANSQNFTVSGWVKTPADISDKVITVAFPGWGFTVMTDGAAYIGDFSTWNSPSPPGTISADTWFHYVSTVEDGLGKLYINNVLVATATGYVMEFLVNTQFSIAWDSNNNFASGLIQSHDATGIWTRVLSLSEISYLYNDGTGIELF
jgi:hypothetical protein